MKYLSMLILAIMVTGCGTFEDRAPADGHATARRHISGNGSCSSEYLKHELWRMENLGFSPKYLDRFARAYQGTCDRHWDAVSRQAKIDPKK